MWQLFQWLSHLYGRYLTTVGFVFIVAEEGWIASIYERQIWNSYDQVVCHTVKPS